SRLFHETLTRRQFMTVRSCGRFDRERKRRVETEGHGRLRVHAPQNRHEPRGFARLDYSEDDRFIRQERVRESGEARRIDILPKQLDENPAGDRTSARERSEWQSSPGGPVIPQHSARPKNKCAKNDAKN